MSGGEPVRFVALLGRIRHSSGEHGDGRIRPEDILDPAVERRDVRAGLDARARVLGERDPGTGEQPQERVSLALDLALTDALDLALADALELAAIDELLHERGE